MNASPDVARIERRCRHFEACGGCLWQDVPYEDQLERKRRSVQDLLHRALGSRHSPIVDPTLAPADPPWGFRTKVHFVLGAGERGRGLVMGHYRRGSQAIVPVEECPVHAEAGNRIAFAFRDALSDGRVPAVTGDLRGGVVRHVVVRVAQSSGQSLATLVVTRNDKLLRPAVRRVLAGDTAPAGLHLNVHPRPGSFLFGPDTTKLAGLSQVRERINDVDYLVSPTSFFQTNVLAAGRMVDLVLAELSGAATVLDLYGGAGLFSLPLAKRGARVTVVEESAGSVTDGDASRRVNRIAESRCRFVRARAEDVASGFYRRVLSSPPDAVVMDPPRQGCSRAVMSWVAHTLRPPAIAYVSCNPEALASDAGALVAAGYRVRRVQPIDMFPHTPHIEAVALFGR